MKEIAFAIFCLITSLTYAKTLCSDALAEIAGKIQGDVGTRWLHAQSPDLHRSEPVEAIAMTLGLKKPADKLMAWVKYLEQVFKNTQTKERYCQEYLNTHVLRPEDVPESHFELQRRIAREAGHGDTPLTPQKRKELSQAVTQNQRESLRSWFDYLTSEDTKHYAPWLRAFVLNEVTKLGKFDPETKKFTRRDKNQVAPFPELNREALARVMARLEELAKKESRSTFSFAVEYGHELSQAVANRVDLTVTDGTWVKYEKGSDPNLLAKALVGCNTGWCSANIGNAENQLRDGDFYVYFSNNAEGLPKVPRLGILTKGTKIAEVRGIAKGQHVDPHMTTTPILDKKLMEFGEEGKLYRKRDAHMRQITEMEQKLARNEDLTGAQVAFLYGIDGPIQSFGYGADPRVKEIMDKREAIAIEDLARVLVHISGGQSEIAEIVKALKNHNITNKKALEILKEKVPEKFYSSNIFATRPTLELVAGTSIQSGLENTFAEAFIKSEAARPNYFAYVVAEGLCHSDKSVVGLAKKILEVSKNQPNPRLQVVVEIENLAKKKNKTHKEAVDDWLSDKKVTIEAKTIYLINRARTNIDEMYRLEDQIPASQRQEVREAVLKYAQEIPTLGIEPNPGP